MLVNTFFENKLDRLRDSAGRIAAVMEKAGVPYRVVGGYATFVHVDRIDPVKARLTADVDVAVDRADLGRIREVAAVFGLQYRPVAGVDMLVEENQPGAHTAIHLIFVREKVRPEHLEPVPEFSEPGQSSEGVLIAPVADLVTMKLTSFRLKDKLHLQDMDSAGLITSEIEAGLSEPLRTRLAEVRATE
jgi:hypothetical protein